MFSFAALGLVLWAGPSPAGDEAVLDRSAEEWASLYDPPSRAPAEIPKGSKLRKALFDQLRPKIAALVGGRAVLFEGSLKAYRNWAFFSGRSVDAAGESVPIGELENDDTVALWIRTIEGWRLVDFSGGHSDVFYSIWPEKYGTPKRLLGFAP